MIDHEHRENHEHQESSKICRVCKSSYCHDCHPSRTGICEKCGYKILIVLVCAMIVISYVWWFGVF